MNSNSRGLAAVMVAVGLAATGIFTGCGGGGDVDISTKGTGGKAGDGGAGGMGAGGMGGSAPVPCNNNGKVEDLEACDDGNMVSGDGCEDDCNFTCNNKSPATGDVKCDDTDPCNGAETCQDDHTCAKGKTAPDGTDCSNSQICIAGICSPDQCGDLFVSATEECEDGNVVNGDGCDSCKFSCLSNDPVRNCTNLDPCIATSCDDTTHTCGSPLPDGGACGMGQICKNGACTATICGDGILEGSEVCDDNNLNDGDGCDADCTLSCVNPATDCPAAQVCQTNACTATFVCVTNNEAVDPLCLSPSTCQDGACTAPACGNGKLEIGEDCDFVGGNGPNTGCETNCKFSCAVDTDCLDMNSCNGLESCATVTVDGQTGKLCSAGTNEMDCSVCTGGVCKMGACTASTCGDGCLDGAVGEQCEPPNTPTCNATCQIIQAIVCGNGIREGSEQCDDSNLVNMDGCSRECKFEQIQRVNWLAMQFATDTFCTVNRLGSAIAGTGQGPINNAVTTGVNTGNISVMFQALGLDDLSGTNDPLIEIGTLNGVPVAPPAGVTYNGASDLDWWYTVGAPSLDPNRQPVDRLAASIAGKLLTAGPGALTLNITLGGSPAPLKMSNARITASIGNVSTPLASTGTTPGHLASENLDPTLQSFATMAQPNANAAAKLCGNVTAASLALVPVPGDLLPGGQFPCNQGYTTANNLLDVLIGGCNVTILNIAVINIRQPDQQDPVVPNVGTGFPYTLQRDPVTKSVNGCRDMSGANVNLALCLQDAAYSAFFKFATDRVIGK